MREAAEGKNVGILPPLRHAQYKLEFPSEGQRLYCFGIALAEFMMGVDDRPM